jgi:hypothetical protein
MFRAGLLLIIRIINTVYAAIFIVMLYIPIAIYTELILLMMSSKSARNM